MGKNSRQRHAAKRRRVAARRRIDVGPSGVPERPSADPERELLLLVRLLWRRGWQPAELARQVRRSELPRACRGLIVELIAADAAASVSADDVVHPAWVRQTDRLAAKANHQPTVAGWFERWLAAQPDLVIAARAMAALARHLLTLRSLPKLIAPPGETECDLPSLVGVDDPSPTSGKLAKIRALLAKAESTEFQAEADALTAKAQAMMAAEQIDAASVRVRSGDRRSTGRVTAVRIAFDEPYVDDQALLLHAVSEPNACRAIHHRGSAMSTVVGPVDIIGHVELLFTSLLIQVHAGLAAQSSSAQPGDRRRSRTYRSSYIAGFAERICVRLRAARDGVFAAAPGDALPVLAADEQATDDLVEQLFGALGSSRGSRRRDRAGLMAGYAAADRAHLRDDGLESSVGSDPPASLPSPDAA